MINLKEKIYLRIKRYTKNGAPIKAATTPIGKFEAVGKTLEIKSQKLKSSTKNSVGINSLVALCLYISFINMRNYKSLQSQYGPVKLIINTNNK